MAQGFIGAASPAGPKMLDNMKPVMKDQSYSTIINTNGSKVETMNAIKNYLIEYEVADSTELSVVDFVKRGDGRQDGSPAYEVVDGCHLCF